MEIAARGGLEEVQVLELRPFLVAAPWRKAGNAALRQAGADAACSKLQFAGIGAILESAKNAGG